MRKYIALGSLAVLMVMGVVLVILVGLKPRPIPKIKPSSFQTPLVVVNALYLRLGQELRGNGILLWGMEPGSPDFIPILKEFIRLNQNQGMPIQVFLVDRNMESLIPDLKDISGERFDSEIDGPRLLEALKNFQQNKLRTLVILSPPQVSSNLPMSLAAHFKEAGLAFLSLNWMDFPRRREDEGKRGAIPCEVATRDKNGTGKLGCDVLMQARLHYRKKFTPGEMVGFLTQMSQFDYLFLLTREP